MAPRLILETERESEGKWIAEVRGLPGCLVYGTSEADAVRKVIAFALRALAEQIEDGDTEAASLIGEPLLATA